MRDLLGDAFGHFSVTFADPMHSVFDVHTASGNAFISHGVEAGDSFGASVLVPESMPAALKVQIPHGVILPAGTSRGGNGNSSEDFRVDQPHPTSCHRRCTAVLLYASVVSSSASLW